jgi:hypothetical protein
MRRYRRAGLSLLEVLVAIFVMGIGIISLLVLFPLGLLNVKGALDNELVARSAYTGQSHSEIPHKRVTDSDGEVPYVSLEAQSLRNDDNYRPDPNNTAMLWWKIQSGKAFVEARIGRSSFLLYSSAPGIVPSTWTFSKRLIPPGATLPNGLPSVATRPVFPAVFVDPRVAIAVTDASLGLPSHVGATNPTKSRQSPFGDHPLPPTVRGNLRPNISLGLPRCGLSYFLNDQGRGVMPDRMLDETSTGEVMFAPDGRPGFDSSLKMQYPVSWRITWSYLCRWPDYDRPDVCDLSVVAFDSRGFGETALTFSPPGEHTYPPGAASPPSLAPSVAAGLEAPGPQNFGRNFRKGFSFAVIPLRKSAQPSSISRGDWILDNTFILPEFNELRPDEVAPFLDEYSPATVYLFPSGNRLFPGLVGGHFYKVVDISGPRAIGDEFYQVVTLDRPARSDGFVITAFNGLVDVIPKSTGRTPAR